MQPIFSPMYAAWNDWMGRATPVCVFAIMKSTPLANASSQSLMYSFMKPVNSMNG